MKRLLILPVTALLLASTALGASPVKALKSASPSTQRHRTASVLKQRRTLPAMTAPQTLLTVPGTNTRLCATMVYNDDWGTTDSNGNYINPITAGVYTIPAKPDGTISSIYQNTDFTKMRCGVKVNSTYYVVSATADGTSASISEYSTTSWNRSRNEETDIVNVATDLTYDPTTGKVYGAFYNMETDEYDRFCSFSLTMAEATDIGDLERRVSAMACNDAGEIYAIWGYTGWLVKLDKKTGRYTQIGKTGVYPEYNNTMAFGTDGVLYWAATDDKGKAALYSVDTTTGVATKIYDMPGNAEFAGMYAQPLSIPDSAPEAVTDIAVAFDSDFATTGRITFTAPTRTANGTTLTEPITAIVAVNGAEVEIVEGIQPGANAQTPTITFAEGLQSIEITTANSTDRGKTASTTVWAGEDLPTAVADLSVSLVDGVPEVSWTAPTEGAHGGKINTAALRYTVTRYPGGTVVADRQSATSVKDTGIGSSAAAVYYEVVASTDKGAGESARTEKIVVGNGYTVPFVEPFDTQDAFDLWTVIDRNGGSTWTYDNGRIHYKYNNNSIGGDDWLISPRIALRSGTTYLLTFDAQTFNSTNYYENFTAVLASDPEAASHVVLKEFTNYCCTAGETHKISFSVDADGYYYLGFHDTSDDKKGWSLFLDNIGIKTLQGALPTAPTEARATAAAQGALRAEIAFTAPTTDIDGAALGDELTVSVVRGNDTTPCYSRSATPGESVSWTDDAITASGTYTYRIYASNEVGDGIEVKVSTFVGLDAPAAVTFTSAKATDTSATIQWTAPTTGVNGGYFNPADLHYRILRSDGTVVAEQTTETSLTDIDIPTTNKQEYIYYVVTPYAADRKGAYAMSPYLIVGTPYNTPFAERFKNSDMERYPWISEPLDDGATWSLQDNGINPATADQSGDNGLATFNSADAPQGTRAELASPKVSLAGLTAPELSFMLYHTATAGNGNITVKVYADDTAHDVANGTFTRKSDAAGWQRHTVDLSQFVDAESIRVAFVGESDCCENIHIDNVTIDEARLADLQLTSLSGPHRIATGIDATYNAVITNIGHTAIEGAVVTLSEADNAIARATVDALAPNQSANIPLTCRFAESATHRLTASVACNADANVENNSAQITTVTVDPVIPAPYDATSIALADGIEITWKAPFSRGAVTDDIESYQDWAIADIGDWTTIDLDHDTTYGIQKDLDEYPNEYDPKAFQVCNAHTLGIDIWDEGKPHSGNKMLMAMSSINYVNNDWLISPQLNGSEQTVSFYAKSFTTDDIAPERMRVLYSMGGTDPTEFVQIHTDDYIELPDAWTRYTWTLPEGARHFAINCVSNNSFALFVDDLSFNDLTVPPLTLRSYEIYRNDELVATTDETRWVDTTPVDKATYKVRALYDRWTSDFATVTASQGAVDGIAATDMTVYGSRQSIVIVGAQGSVVKVFGIDGRMLAQVVPDRMHYTLDIAPGIYLVELANISLKIVVH